MATVINNPGNGESNGGGAGLIIGIVILVVVVALFFIYGLPAMRNNDSGTTVNVPDQIDVNVDTPSTNQ